MAGVTDNFPPDVPDERELYLAWLAWLRGAVVRKAAALPDEQARWRPEGRLISLIGIVNHLTNVERRWMDGGFLGAVVSRREEEFAPRPEVSLAAVVGGYRRRAARTEATVRSLPLDAPCAIGEGKTLRWVLLHLVNETARHAGHADATRELLDGLTGE
jgi:uncharacterized damage-inducible protein DinB